MTANFLIIKKLNCHLSLVTFYMYLCSADRRRFSTKIDERYCFRDEY